MDRKHEQQKKGQDQGINPQPNQPMEQPRREQSDRREDKRGIDVPRGDNEVE